MTHTCDIATVGETGTAIEKRSEETQTLLPTNQAKNFRPAVDPLPGGAGRPKFNQLEIVTTLYLHPQTQFGENRCTQFRVIVVTDTARPPVANTRVTDRTDNNTLHR